MFRSAPWLVLLVSLGIGARCDDNPDARYARDYEGCFHAHVGDICGDGPQVCTETPYQRGNFVCSESCSSAADCEILEGRDIGCAVGPDGGLCVVLCADDDDCPWGNICLEGNGPAICHPD